MLQYLKGQIFSIYRNYKDYRTADRRALIDKARLSGVLQNASPLSKDEINLITEKWGGIIRNIKPGLSFYNGLKYLDRFNENYLPTAYYYPYIERVLNPEDSKYQLGHKGMIQMIFSDVISHPDTLLRSYGRVMLDSKYRQVSPNEAIKIIHSSDQPLLYKPAVGTVQGMGIRKFELSEVDNLCNLIKTGELLTSDFVVQEIVTQSNETKIFNPSSLNCMRITTLNLNGHISVGSRAIKCGPENSVVDNIGDGRRGVITGIHPDGILCERGFYGNGDITEDIRGLKFKGLRIDHFNLVEEAAIRLHEIVPACKIIGWDIALDENNNPILIEGNTVFPGICLEQMCSGPIFGDRTDEVIDYVKSILKIR